MDNVLNCKLVEVEGRIYRVQGGEGRIIAPYTSDELEEHELKESETKDNKYDISQMNELSNEDYDESVILKQDDNTYYTTISLDNQLYRHIIGVKGQIKKKIELESGATVIVPGQKDAKANEIVIKGTSPNFVESARTRIEVIIEELYEGNLEYNFFVSIPLATKNIIQNYEKFKKEVFSEIDAPMANIDKTIFIKSEHLHLTILMLKLYSNEKRALALEAMNESKEKINEYLKKDEKINLNVIGLEYMNDDPADINVLYAKIQDLNHDKKLIEIFNIVIDVFTKYGLVQFKDEKPAKIHATLINTRYRKSDDDAIDNSVNVKARASFDGRYILSIFRNFEFGKFELNEIHLSHRFEYDKMTQYYKTFHTIKL